MKLEVPRAALVILLVANLAGCVSFGELLMPIFCTAPRPGWDWFAWLQGLLLITTAPLLLAAFLSGRIRTVAALVGVLALAGLVTQSVLLEHDKLYCDVP